MKKKNKILLSVTGAFLLLFAVLYMGRNVLIVNAFKTLVAQESDGRIALDIKGVRFNIFTNDLTIDSLTLRFNNKGQDSSSSNTVMEKLSFSQITLNRLDVQRLILDKVFKAQSFVVSHPSLRLLAASGKEKEIKDPRELFAVFEHTSADNYGLLVKLDTLKVRYGRIKIKRADGDAIDFSTSDMALTMIDFNTLAEDTGQVNNRIFFAKTIRLSVKDLYKYLNDGYHLHLNELTWQSDSRDFVVNGIRLLPDSRLSSKKPVIKLNISLLKLNDFLLKEKDSAYHIKLSKVHLKDGAVDLKIKSNNGKKSGDWIARTLLESVQVDTLQLDRLKVFVHQNETDTALFFRHLTLRAKHVTLDSGFVADPVKFINYQGLHVHAESLASKTLLPGFIVHNSVLNYDGSSEKMALRSFELFKSDSSFYTKIAKIEFELSLKKWLKKQRQNFDVRLIEPYVKIDLSGKGTGLKGKKEKEDGNPLLIPEDVDIVDGRFDFFEKQRKVGDVRGLRLFTKNLVYIKDSLLKYDTLFVKTNTINLGKDSARMVRVNDFIFNDRWLKIGSAAIRVNKKYPVDLELVSLRLKNPDIEEMLINSTIKADTLEVAESVETIRISEVKGKSDRLTDRAFDLATWVGRLEKKQKFHVDIGFLNVEKNHILLKKENQADHLSFQADSKLSWKNLKWGWDGDKPISDLSGMCLLTSDVRFSNNANTFELDSLHFDSDRGALLLKGYSMKLGSNRDKGNDEVLINNLKVKTVSVGRFDVKKLLSENQIVFGKLKIDNVVLDAEKTVLSRSGQKSISPVEFKMDSLFPFAVLFDTVEVNELFLKYGQRDSINLMTYRLHDFSLAFLPSNRRDSTSLNAGSFLKNLTFSFDSLFVHDSISNMSLDIDHGMFNKEKDFQKLVFKDVFLNSGKKEGQRTQLITGTGEFKMEGISSGDSLPLKVGVRKLSFSDMDLKVINQAPKDVKELDTTFKRLAGLYKISKLLDKLHIDTVLFANVDLKVFKQDSTKKRITVDNLKLSVSDVDLYPGKARDTIPFDVGNINAMLFNKRFISGDSLYRFEAKVLSYNTFNHSLVIDSFYVKPRFDTLEFFKRKGWQTDRINMFVKRFVFKGFDIDRWNRSGFFHLNHISVEGLVANIYRDKNFPRDTSVIKPLLQGMLNSVKQPFRIDSVTVRRAYFKYSELGEKSFKPGYVYFTDGSLHAYHITNRPEKGLGETLKVSLGMRLMGEGKIWGNFYFPLEQGDQFYYNAKSEKLDLTTLNPMTQNLLGLSISYGKGRLNIPLVTADDELATGYLLFKYRMKIQLYNRKKAEKNKEKGVTSPLLNFIINGLVLKNRNPNWFNRPRVGVVYFKRDKNKALPNYIWKSTLSGVLSTMGFNSKEQRKKRKDYKKSDFVHVELDAIKEEKEKRAKKDKK